MSTEINFWKNLPSISEKYILPLLSELPTVYVPFLRQL
jgi:hypothetical protein